MTIQQPVGSGVVGARSADGPDRTAIEGMEREVKRLRRELREVEKKLFRARCDAAGVRIGDRVRGTGRFAGVVIKVREIMPLKHGKPWIAGWLVADDGTVTRHWQDLFDEWEPTP